MTSDLCFCVTRVRQSVFHGATVGSRSLLKLCFHLITDMCGIQEELPQKSQCWDLTVFSPLTLNESTVTHEGLHFGSSYNSTVCTAASQFLVLFFHFSLFL